MSNAYEANLSARNQKRQTPVHSPQEYLFLCLFSVSKESQEIPPKREKCPSATPTESHSVSHTIHPEILHPRRLPIIAAKLRHLLHLTRFLENPDSRRFYAELQPTEEDRSSDEEVHPNADS
ncbi:hypothetical protein HHI36_001534 [Cryptolaemus montrouzieri]|uniref:Uncharacterized protein n=1 Tax=Cryptolaemus montrouzieri TaxID=559131 RepID=A0ABD2P8K1_9CUCU